MAVQALVLGHHLAAGAAGRGGHFADFVPVRPHDGQRVEGHAGMVRAGGEHGGALRAEAGGIGNVFLVGAQDDGPVHQAEGGAHAEMGIGRVGASPRPEGGFDQFPVLGFHLVGGGILDVIDGDASVGHSSQK